MHTRYARRRAFAGFCYQKRKGKVVRNMRKTITLKSIIISLLRIIDYGIRLVLIALVCLRGQYYNLICNIAGELAGSEYLVLKNELLQLTSGSSFIFEAIMFGVCMFSATSVRFVLSRCLPKSSKNIIVSGQEHKSRKRCFAEERKEHKKPCFVIPVFEIVPAFLN